MRPKDSNVTIQARVKSSTKQDLGKENSISSPQGNTCVIPARCNNVEPSSMPPSAIHHPSKPASPSRHQAASSPGKDVVYRTGDGKPVSCRGEPPDSQGGDSLQDMGGARAVDSGIGSHVVDSQ